MSETVMGTNELIEACMGMKIGEQKSFTCLTEIPRFAMAFLVLSIQNTRLQYEPSFKGIYLLARSGQEVTVSCNETLEW